MATERFTKDHEWIRLDGGIATVGITEHAQTQLGDVVFVELPDVGRKVAQSEAVAVVESVKAASDVFSADCRRGDGGQRRSHGTAGAGQRGCRGQGLVLQGQGLPTRPNSTR
jgi:hypothetical protein